MGVTRSLQRCRGPGPGAAFAHSFGAQGANRSAAEAWRGGQRDVQRCFRFGTLEALIQRQLISKSGLIKGSLEEILPSYEKLRSVCAHVRDAKRSRLTVGRVGTLGAAHVRRGFGACAARPPSRLRHSFSLIFWCA